jgi:RHS repeat-associated protein
MALRARCNDVATGLVYLRARYYSPHQARFVTEDIWDGNYTKPLSLNGWIYVEGNPTNYVDSSGFTRNLSGPIQFINCFDFSIGKGFDSPWISAQEAVDSCRAAYSKNAWSGWENRFGLNDGNKELPTTAVELFGWFVFENGDSDHLWFDGTEPLTKELAHSLLTHNVRHKYYQTGDITNRVHHDFNLPQVLSSLVYDFRFNISISQLIGSFWYQVRTLDDNRIGIRIDNDTTLESGSHFAGRYEKGGFIGSVEDLIVNDEISVKEPLYSIVNNPEYRVISILTSRERGETDYGGGNLYQTYTWTEKRDPCFLLDWPISAFRGPKEIEPWIGFENLTEKMPWE